MIDLGPPPLTVNAGLWVPQRPAIIRRAPQELLDGPPILKAVPVPGAPVAAAPAVAAGLTLAFRASATSLGENITIPATAEAGDVAVLIDWAIRSTPTPTKVIPAGWDEVPGCEAVITDFMRGLVSTRILDAGDPDTAVTGMGGEFVFVGKVMLVFSGGVTSVVPADEDGEGTNDNPASQTVTAGGGTSPLVVIGIAASSTGGEVVFSTAAPSFDATVKADGSGYQVLAGYKIYNAESADHTVDMDDLGSNNYLATCYLEVA